MKHQIIKRCVYMYELTDKSEDNDFPASRSRRAVAPHWRQSQTLTSQK